MLNSWNFLPYFTRHHFDYTYQLHRSRIERHSIFPYSIILCFLSGECRQLEFNHIFDGKRLKNHVIRTVDVPSERSCRTLCYMEPNCVSYNFNKVKRKCELNNSTLKEVEENMQESNPNYVYSGAKVDQDLSQYKKEIEAKIHFQFKFV